MAAPSGPAAALPCLECWPWLIFMSARSFSCCASTAFSSLRSASEPMERHCTVSSVSQRWQSAAVEASSSYTRRLVVSRSSRQPFLWS